MPEYDFYSEYALPNGHTARTADAALNADDVCRYAQERSGASDTSELRRALRGMPVGQTRRIPVSASHVMFVSRQS